MLYGINPFDEFGVDYGKTLAGPIVAALSDGTALPPDTDGSTRGLVAHVRTRIGVAPESAADVAASWQRHGSRSEIRPE